MAPPGRRWRAWLALFGVLALSFVIVVSVFSGSSWGPLSEFHPAAPAAAPPHGLTVSAAVLLISYRTGPSGILGATNQSVCGECPLRFDPADPCGSPVEVLGTLLVRNTDSRPHTISGVSSPTSVPGSNDTWGVSLWNRSGAPMLGPYSLPPGSVLPFDVLNMTLNGGCGAVRGTVAISLDLQWS